LKAVIMAGGKGTRLRPLTCHVPKPMVPLLDRPCMEYIIELLERHDITDIAVTTQYLSDIICDYFGNGNKWGVNLHYFEETTPLGTAGSVKNAQSFLDERFVVISGDALTDLDLKDALTYHERNKALVTMVLKRVQHPLEFGVVMIDDVGRIVRFLEKPGWSEVFSDTVNTGIYILEPEVLDGVTAGQEYDFSQQLFPALLQQGKSMYGYITDRYWSDIGDLDQYKQTQFDMLDRKVQVRISGIEARPGIFVGENVQYTPTARCVGPAFIGDHTVIENGVEIGPYSVVGSRNRLAGGSSLHRTVLWDNNRIDEHNELLGSIICSRITSKTGSQYQDGSVVGSQCMIGAKSVIYPNVRIWPKKQLRDGMHVQQSLIWGERTSKSLFGRRGVCGIPNVEMTPEFSAKFAAAFGSTLKPSGVITVSRSADIYAGLLSKAVIAGLQSVGIQVVDSGILTPSAGRHTVRCLKADGAVHIQMSWNGQSVQYVYECYDENGLPITKSMQRKVENAFRQEDYKRVEATLVRDVKADQQAVSRYVEQLRNRLSMRLTRSQPYRIVICAPAYMVQIVGLMVAGQPCIFSMSDKEQMTHTIKQWKADFGVWISDDAEQMEFYSNEGESITGVKLMLVRLLNFFHTNKECCTIGLPISMPDIAQSLIEGLGGVVTRIKEDRRMEMESCSVHPFHPLYDPIYSIGVLLNNLDQSQLHLSDILKLIPEYYLVNDAASCPWESKGRVMRLLVERTKHQQVELLDGVKILNPEDGWVLLMPDEDEARFNLIVQSSSQAQAEQLANHYKKLISHDLQ
jgi:mannose-1-phosphate guanylyltransferase/phosphomannomutase